MVEEYAILKFLKIIIIIIKMELYLLLMSKRLHCYYIYILCLLGSFYSMWWKINSLFSQKSLRKFGAYRIFTVFFLDNTFLHIKILLIIMSMAYGSPHSPHLGYCWLVNLHSSLLPLCLIDVDVCFLFLSKKKINFHEQQW